MAPNKEVEESKTPSTTVSINRQAWDKLKAWCETAQEKNPAIYSPSNVINVLMVEFLKQVTKDPALVELDQAIERAAYETAKRKS